MFFTAGRISAYIWAEQTHHTTGTGKPEAKDGKIYPFNPGEGKAVNTGISMAKANSSKNQAKRRAGKYPVMYVNTRMLWSSTELRNFAESRASGNAKTSTHTSTPLL